MECSDCWCENRTKYEYVTNKVSSGAMSALSDEHAHKIVKRMVIAAYKKGDYNLVRHYLDTFRPAFSPMDGMRIAEAIGEEEYFSYFMRKNICDEDEWLKIM